MTLIDILLEPLRYEFMLRALSATAIAAIVSPRIFAANAYDPGTSKSR